MQLRFKVLVRWVHLWQAIFFLALAVTLGAVTLGAVMQAPSSVATGAVTTLSPAIGVAGGKQGERLAVVATEEPTTTLTSVYLPLLMRPARVFLPMIDMASPFGVPTPANGAVGQSLNRYLLWSLTAPAELQAPIVYTVYLEAWNPTPSGLVAVSQQRLYLDLATFAADRQYYWRVVAIDALGRQVESPVWTFRTEAAGQQPDLGAMVAVPAGPFQMGCDRTNPAEEPCSYNLYHNDEPVRTITLDAFEIDKYEVTNQEYKACMEAGVCAAPRVTDRLSNPSMALNPVLFVSWWNAQSFCAWEWKRLPTEAEWEKAARGAIDTRKWPWGNEAADCTRARSLHVGDGENCIARPMGVTDVGQFPRGASPYGAHDMAGNAFEWVQDKYDVWYYVYSPLVNPQGPPYSRVRKTLGVPTETLGWEHHGYPVFSIRGGSWRDNPTYMRVAHRHWGHHGETPNTDEPYFRSDRVGFRCARTVLE